MLSAWSSYGDPYMRKYFQTFHVEAIQVSSEQTAGAATELASVYG
jgi:hypothetical protein